MTFKMLNNMLRSPADEGAGGGGLMDSHQLEDEGGDDQQQDDGGQQQEEQQGRPDYVPEQFWDGDKNEPRLEQMAKAYGDLRSEFNKLKNDGGSGKAPEEVGAYLEDFKMPTERGEGDDKQVLDRVKAFDADDPALQAFAEIAHKRGWSKETFNEILGETMFAMNGLLPEPLDELKEIELLGGKDAANKVLDVNKRWLDHQLKTGSFSEEEHAFAKQFAASAIGVQTLNKLREMAGEKPIPVNASHGEGVKSQADIQAMMDDPLYKDASSKGDAFRARVEQEILKSTGDGPAGSSDQVAFGG